MSAMGIDVRSAYFDPTIRFSGRSPTTIDRVHAFANTRSPHSR